MGKKRFAVAMAVYAVVFLILAGLGLKYFWDFLSAFEGSRRETAVKCYVASLTAEDVIAGTGEMMETLDGNLQSREASEQVIRETLTGEFHWASRGEDIYAILDGERIIGEISIEPGEEDRFGFTPWAVSEECYDFSWLMGEEIRISVPAAFQVRVNGTLLDDGYVVDSRVPYPILEDFYGEYEMPYMVTYCAGSFLGEADVNIADEAGEAVEDLTDPSAFLDTCTDTQKETVKKAMEIFLGRYVTFTGSANDMALENYYNLRRSLVADSALAKRLYTAIDGLTYAQSYSDEIQSIEYEQVLQVEEGRFLCQAAYFVRTSGRGGVFTTENRVKVILVETDAGLKVEAMTRI